MAEAGAAPRVDVHGGVRPVPWWLRIAYTLFVLALVPVYTAQYGAANFLWFSNIALLATLAAVWLGNRLLAGMMAVGVLLPEIGWNLLFWSGLLFGVDVLGLVAYMFDPGIPFWVRLFSLYHVLLPILLLWLVRRWGYEKRALRWQTALAWIVLPLSLLVTTPAENVNYVYGLVDEAGRPALAPPLPLLLLMAGFPLAIYWPTHAALRRWRGEARGTGEPDGRVPALGR